MAVIGRATESDNARASGRNGDRSDGVPRSRMHYTLASAVEPEPVRWLWPQRVPLGKLSMIDGDPELGKSTIAVDIAARATTGMPMPGEDTTCVEPCNVVIMSGEDDAADTLVPRLMAAGADLDRVLIVTEVEIVDEHGTVRLREPMFPADIELLRNLIAEHDAKLVVVDVLAAYLTGVKMSSDQEMRSMVLRPLRGVAESTGCAVVSLRHFRKSERSNAVLAGGGTIGISGAARVGNFVAWNPDDDTDDPNERERLFAVAKSNIGLKPRVYAYRLVESHELAERGLKVARVFWIGTTDHDSGALLDRPADDERDERAQMDDALADLLADGPIPQPEVVKTLGPRSSFGWSVKQLRGALKRLGGETRKRGGTFGGDPGWYWSFSAEDDRESTEDAEGTRVQNEEPSASSGHLQSDLFGDLDAPDTSDTDIERSEAVQIEPSAHDLASS